MHIARPFATTKNTDEREVAIRAESPVTPNSWLLSFFDNIFSPINFTCQLFDESTAAAATNIIQSNRFLRRPILWRHRLLSTIVNVSDNAVLLRLWSMLWLLFCQHWIGTEVCIPETAVNTSTRLWWTAEREILIALSWCPQWHLWPGKQSKQNKSCQIKRKILLKM